MRNHHRLRIPVRAHLGAAINFQAGSVKRAPKMIRDAGLEWLWRIKEEPHLGARYCHDGRLLLRLMLTRVLPLAFQARLRRWRRQQELYVGLRSSENCVALDISGDAITQYISRATDQFQQALALASPSVVINLAAVRQIDQRFLGLLLMLRKCLRRRGTPLLFVGVPDWIRRLFQLNEVEFLLNE